MSCSRMCEGKIHSLRHGSSMEDSISTQIISETTYEHICHASTSIWEENNIVNIRCDDLIYEAREVIASVTSSQEDSVNSVDCSDRCDRALRGG
jgi:predicted metal-binding protein